VNKDQAINKLMTVPQVVLAEQVYYMHKDQYGAKGHHVMKYSVPELVSWILSHYEWNDEHQIWNTKFPLDDETFIEETVH
jgi:hypothetical protein